MTSQLTSSTGMLGGKIGSLVPLFSPVPVPDTVFFDESTRQTNNRETISVSGSIDTSQIDAYTQGVELTTERRYVAGVAKIWSGEPGHVLKKNRFGMDRNAFPSAAFSDLDFFNPQVFIEAQDAASPLWQNVFSYPIILGDNDQLDSLNFDGVIEPLSIRKPASFTSIEVPFEAHAVYGSFGVGNIDVRRATDQVFTIDVHDVMTSIGAFLDMQDGGGAFLDNNPSRVSAFIDQRLVRNEDRPTFEPSDMVETMSMMTGSTDNYIKHNQRSATCGWVYDNTTKTGTDSLAFGGMTY